METIVVEYDTELIYASREGAYIARLASNRGIYGVSPTAEQAVKECIKTARTFQYSGERSDYQVVQE